MPEPENPENKPIEDLEARAERLEHMAERQEKVAHEAEELAKEEWPRRRASDLRSFAIDLLERHLERRIRSARALERS